MALLARLVTIPGVPCLLGQLHLECGPKLDRAHHFGRLGGRALPGAMLAVRGLGVGPLAVAADLPPCQIRKDELCDWLVSVRVDSGSWWTTPQMQQLG